MNIVINNIYLISIEKYLYLKKDFLNLMYFTLIFLYLNLLLQNNFHSSLIYYQFLKYFIKFDFIYLKCDLLTSFL